MPISKVLQEAKKVKASYSDELYWSILKMNRVNIRNKIRDGVGSSTIAETLKVPLDLFDAFIIITELKYENCKFDMPWFKKKKRKKPKLRNAKTSLKKTSRY